MATRLKLRRDTAANWTAANPVLAAGEPGITTDPPRILKVGDGVTAWATLPAVPLAHLDVADAHDATGISVDPTGLTVVTGTDVQAAVAQLDAKAGSGASVSSGKATRQSTAQSIPNGAFTAITFDTEVFDSGALVNLATQATRVTIDTAGVYAIKAGCIFVGNSTGVRIIAIRKNGATYLMEDMRVGSTTASGMSVSVDDQAAVGDYYEALVYQNIGAALNLVASVYNHLSVAKVG